MVKLDSSWKAWIKENKDRGCCQTEMKEIMINAGLNINDIENELNNKNQEPTQPKLTINKAMNNNQLSEKNLSYLFLNNIYLPNIKKIQTNKINLNIIENFLDKDTCEKLIKIIRRDNRRSTITTYRTEEDKEFRTSQTCDMPQDDDTVKKLEKQMATYLGYENERTEHCQGQYYKVGNQFKAHTDWFTRDTEEWDNYAKDDGQRTWTFMIYLNDVEEGGETEFTNLDIKLKPKMGMGVLWNNMDSTGEELNDTLHWGKPPIKGEKFIITKWFREFGTLTNYFKPRLSNIIINHTPLGFKKLNVPKKLFDTIQTWYKKNKKNEDYEDYDKSLQEFIFTPNGIPDKCPAKMCHLPSDIKKQIENELLVMLEEWAGDYLEWTSIYGIRNYQRDAILKMHTDKYDTHIVSFIINVHQDVDEDWPLRIEDHYGKPHDVILKPGDMLFYESLRCMHGRPTPFKGTNFANIFGHTRSLTYKKEVEKIIYLKDNKIIR